MSRFQLAAGLVAGVAALCPAGCGPPTAADVTKSTEASAAAALVRVAAAKPQWKTIRVATVQPARVEPFEVTPLYAKISGYVQQVAVDIGDPVEAGTTLLTIAAPEMDRELDQKKALVEQARAEVGQAAAAIRASEAAVSTARAGVREAAAGLERVEADYQRSLSEHSRISELAERGSVSGKLVEEARYQLAAAAASRTEVQARIDSAGAVLEESEARLAKSQADAQAADARLHVAEADRDRVQALVGYATITAPFAGVVTERHVDTGHFVQPAAGMTARPLLVVARNDKLRIVVEVPEAEAALVDREDQVTIRVPALDGREFTEPVARTSWALESANRTLRTEIDYTNRDGLLRPGMYATVRIELAEHADVVALPAAALVYEAGQALCCVVQDGCIVRTPVTPGLRSGGEVEITAGLTGDELVVQARGESLSEGQAVEMLADEQPR